MMTTKRDYLVGLGLAKAGARGRFSREANAAIADARSKGMTFTDDAPAPKATVRASKAPQEAPEPRVRVDAKAARKWAKTQGMAVGDRGRLHPDIISAFMESNPDAPTDVEVTPSGKTIMKESPRLFPADARWGTADRKYTVGGATWCVTCRSSLVYHRCNTPQVVARDGNGFVSVSLIA